MIPKKLRFAFFIIFSLVRIFPSWSQSISSDQAQQIADGLLISNNFKAKVKKMLPQIKNMQVLVLQIPYREYPSIVILNKSTTGWVRIFECLQPGIQDQPSGLLDWHTVKTGADFNFDKSDSPIVFNDKKVKSIIEASLKVKGGVLIPYQNFIYMNTAEKKDPKAFLPYSIDKTSYYEFANKFFDDKYKNYNKTECMMFDTPQVIDCTFDLSGNKFIIKATTANNQIWTYTFDGIDTKNQYLLNKKITVQKAS